MRTGLHTAYMHACHRTINWQDKLATGKTNLNHKILFICIHQDDQHNLLHHQNLFLQHQCIITISPNNSVAVCIAAYTHIIHPERTQNSILLLLLFFFLSFFVLLIFFFLPPFVSGGRFKQLVSDRTKACNYSSICQFKAFNSKTYIRNRTACANLNTLHVFCCTP